MTPQTQPQIPQFTSVKQLDDCFTPVRRLPKFYGCCVYLHRRKTDNTIFYVGIGTRQRAANAINRNDDWHKVVEQHGREVQILHVFDNPADAAALEVALISMLLDSGVELTNRTGGGEGGSRYQGSRQDAMRDALQVMARMNTERLLQPAIERWRKTVLTPYLARQKKHPHPLRFQPGRV